MADLGFRILGGVHRRVYRLTGGKLGGRLGSMPVLLLTTIGRKSGRPHTQPLTYTQSGDGYAVIASKGGAPQHPLWYLNLRANPLADVTVGRETRKVRARDARRVGRSLWSCSSLPHADAGPLRRGSGRPSMGVRLHHRWHRP